MQELEASWLEREEGGFTKIRQSGLIADLRSYVYSLEEVEIQDPVTREVKTEKRAYLWYLDMVGRSREALKAIWAGLVNHPPKPAVLYREVASTELANHAEQLHTLEEEVTSQMWVYLAERERSQGFRWKYTPLPKAAAHQGVLVPQIALARPASFINNAKTKASGKAEPASGQSHSEKHNEATPVLGPVQTQEFLLLALSEFESSREAPLNLARLYYRRLDGLSQIPLLPQWDEWLWHNAQEQGLIKRLASFGCEAYLCQQPQERELAQQVCLALQHRELPLPNDQVAGLLKATSKTLENCSINPNRKEAA